MSHLVRAFVQAVLLVVCIVQPTQQCPQRCQCANRSGRQYVTCDNVDIKTITQDMPDVTYGLEISRANLQELSEDFLGILRYSNIRELFLTYCGIQRLKNNAFSQFPNLEKLTLSNNDISQVSSSAFESLPQLTSLDLSRNKIQNLDLRTFKPLSSSLQSLSLSNNPLRALEDNVLGQLYNMESLTLSYCGLTNLKGIQLKYLSRLSTLDISFNKLLNMSTSSLKTFKTLSSLIVRGNLWHCDCGILPFKQWLQTPVNVRKIKCTGVQSECVVMPKCSSPSSVKDSEIATIDSGRISQCVPKQNDTADMSSIIIAVAVVFACLAIVAIIAVVVHVKFRTRRKMSATTSENGSSKPIHATNHNGAFDVGSINESDRAFPLRNYMQTLDQLSEPFSSVKSESYHTRESDHGSFSMQSSQISLARIDRESAV